MLNIKEYKKTLRIYKLYEVPRNSVVSLVDFQENDPWLFDHIDGMYSLCYSIEEKPEIFHIKALAEVYLWEKIYD